MNKLCKTFDRGGTAATLVFEHNFATKDVIVQVYNPEDEGIEVVIVRHDNSVALLFNEPPDFDVRVIVIG